MMWELASPPSCSFARGCPFAPIPPGSVRLTGQDDRGEPVDLTAEGYLARCFQHEVDHIAGKLYLQRLPGTLRRQALDALR